MIVKKEECRECAVYYFKNTSYPCCACTRNTLRISDKFCKNNGD